MTSLAETTAPPPPPRPLTAAARRRSWGEMPVRIWCVLAVALAGVIVYFTISHVMEGASERELILHGIPVDATLVQIGGSSNPQVVSHRGETLEAIARYTLPGEQDARRSPGALSLSNDPTAVIRPGDHLPLRVDPNDPNVWTDRTEPRSWLVELSVALILLPLLGLMLLIASLQRARILRIWQHGDVAEATVIDLRQTAIAPFSRQVRFTLSDGSSLRVCSVLVPTRAGIPAKGESLCLVMPRGVPQRAVLARLYI